jgi:hypothetical protein
LYALFRNFYVLILKVFNYLTCHFQIPFCFTKE